MIPKKWDIVKLQIETHVGYEIGGHEQLSKNKLKNMSAIDLIKYYRGQRRPVVVLSNSHFNQAGVLECMPVMSHNRLPKQFRQFLIPLNKHTKYHKVHGFVVPLQVLGYDYINRNGKSLDTADKYVQSKIRIMFKNIFANE